MQFSRETSNKIFVPNLLQHLAYEATKLCVYKMAYTDRQHAKQVLKTRFYFNCFTCLDEDFELITVGCANCKVIFID